MTSRVIYKIEGTGQTPGAIYVIKIRQISTSRPVCNGHNWAQRLSELFKYIFYLQVLLFPVASSSCRDYEQDTEHVLVGCKRHIKNSDVKGFKGKKNKIFVLFSAGRMLRNVLRSHSESHGTLTFVI